MVLPGKTSKHKNESVEKTNALYSTNPSTVIRDTTMLVARMLNVLDPLDDPLPAGGVDPLDPLAFARKAAKLFGPDSTALTENTIPWLQWLD